MTVLDAPRGLHNVVVTTTSIGDVRGDEGFYHYRQYSAIDIALHKTFEDAWFLMIEGRLPPPPIAQTLGFTLARIADGEVWFTCEPHEAHYNPIGMVHGGLVCTLLDSALGCAVHTQLPAGVGYTSIEIKVSYLRAVSPASGMLTAHAQVTKPGRRVAFVDGDVRDAAGKIVATASGSCLIMGG